jgi:hypothetical protein
MGTGATPTGERVFRLVNWCGDISTVEGLTPSARLIRTAIRDLYPNTTLARIEGMLAGRHQPRGHHIINPSLADLLAELVE